VCASREDAVSEYDGCASEKKIRKVIMKLQQKKERSAHEVEAKKERSDDEKKRLMNG